MKSTHNIIHWAKINAVKYYIMGVIITINFIFIISCRKINTLEEHAGHGKADFEIRLSPREKLLINLVTETVSTDTIYETLRLLGNAVVNEKNISVISSRVKGRLDKLFIRNPGEVIKYGQLLYAIYSEELLSYQGEYLLLLKHSSENPLGEGKKLALAARDKLLYLGMSETQVIELEIAKRPSNLVNFYSEEMGYLTELNINEGEYVDPGTKMFKLARSASVWVEAQVYPYELNIFELNPQTTIIFDGLPGVFFNGKLIFTSPAFEKDKQINLVRIEIQNRNELVKPGMMATIIVKAGNRVAIVIPKSAVIPGDMPYVWIENNKGNYEMRMIHTGIASKTNVEVIDGLSGGDKVVSSGVYLINSSYILKKGAGSMAGMNM